VLDTNRKPKVFAPGTATEKEKFKFKRITRLIKRAGWRFGGCQFNGSEYVTFLERGGETQTFTTSHAFPYAADANNKIF
jgi:hypothetical protein